MTDANSTVGTLSCLSSLALITVSGADRFTFLQGQLTNDVTRLGNELMPAGYCSPKGRLLATPRLFQEGDTIGMIVAASNADYLVKRLKMYVLRSKVTIERAADREVAGFFRLGSDKSRRRCACFRIALRSAAGAHCRGTAERSGAGNCSERNGLRRLGTPLVGRLRRCRSILGVWRNSRALHAARRQFRSHRRHLLQ